MTEHRRKLKEKLGKDPSTANLYQHTHKRKNGDGAKAQKVVAGASSSNAALMTEIQEMREENKIFREENKFIREELSKMGAIFAKFSANPEFLSSLNLNNSGSQNDETQAHCDED
nr:putative transposase En/Spm [Ipomoea batatas]